MEFDSQHLISEAHIGDFNGSFEHMGVERSQDEECLLDTMDVGITDFSYDPDIHQSSEPPQDFATIQVSPGGGLTLRNLVEDVSDQSELQSSVVPSEDFYATEKHGYPTAVLAALSSTIDSAGNNSPRDHHWGGNSESVPMFQAMNIYQTDPCMSSDHTYCEGLMYNNVTEAGICDVPTLGSSLPDNSETPIRSTSSCTHQLVVDPDIYEECPNTSNSCSRRSSTISAKIAKASQHSHNMSEFLPEEVPKTKVVLLFDESKNKEEPVSIMQSPAKSQAVLKKRVSYSAEPPEEAFAQRFSSSPSNTEYPVVPCVNVVRSRPNAILRTDTITIDPNNTSNVSFKTSTKSKPLPFNIKPRFLDSVPSVPSNPVKTHYMDNIPFPSVGSVSLPPNKSGVLAATRSGRRMGVKDLCDREQPEIKGRYTGATFNERHEPLSRASSVISDRSEGNRRIGGSVKLRGRALGSESRSNSQSMIYGRNMVADSSMIMDDLSGPSIMDGRKVSGHYWEGGLTGNIRRSRSKINSIQSMPSRSGSNRSFQTGIRTSVDLSPGKFKGEMSDHKRPVVRVLERGSEPMELSEISDRSEADRKDPRDLSEPRDRVDLSDPLDVYEPLDVSEAVSDGPRDQDTKSDPRDLKNGKKCALMKEDGEEQTSAPDGVEYEEECKSVHDGYHSLEDERFGGASPLVNANTTLGRPLACMKGGGEEEFGSQEGRTCETDRDIPDFSDPGEPKEIPTHTQPLAVYCKFNTNPSYPFMCGHGHASSSTSLATLLPHNTTRSLVSFENCDNFNEADTQDDNGDVVIGDSLKFSLADSTCSRDSVPMTNTSELQNSENVSPKMRRVTCTPLSGGESHTRPFDQHKQVSFLSNHYDRDVVQGKDLGRSDAYTENTVDLSANDIIPPSLLKFEVPVTASERFAKDTTDLYPNDIITATIFQPGPKTKRATSDLYPNNTVDVYPIPPSTLQFEAPGTAVSSGVYTNLYTNDPPIIISEPVTNGATPFSEVKRPVKPSHMRSHSVQVLLPTESVPSYRIGGLITDNSSTHVGTRVPFIDMSAKTVNNSLPFMETVTKVSKPRCSMDSPSYTIGISSPQYTASSPTSTPTYTGTTPTYTGTTPISFIDSNTSGPSFTVDTTNSTYPTYKTSTPTTTYKPSTPTATHMPGTPTHTVGTTPIVNVSFTAGKPFGITEVFPKRNQPSSRKTTTKNRGSSWEKNNYSHHKGDGSKLLDILKKREKKAKRLGIYLKEACDNSANHKSPLFAEKNKRYQPKNGAVLRDGHVRTFAPFQCEKEPSLMYPRDIIPCYVSPWAYASYPEFQSASWDANINWVVGNCLKPSYHLNTEGDRVIFT